MKKMMIQEKNSLKMVRAYCGTGLPSFAQKRS